MQKVEGNDRLGKTGALFKKIGDTKGTFHAKMSTIKDRHGKDLTETEEIKRGSKNTQNYTQNFLMTQITMMVWSLTWSQTSGV